MAVSVDLRQKIIKLLTAIPNISDPEVRQALIQSAELDPQLQNQISFASSPGTFFQLLLSTLSQYGRLNDGRHAVAALLEVAKSALSKEGRAYCDGLIRELGEEPLLEASDAALPPTLFADIVKQQNTQQGGTTVNVTIGEGAKVKGFNIGDGNQNMADVKAGEDVIQNRDGNVEVHKNVEAASAVETKEDMLQVLKQMQELVAGLDVGSGRTKKAMKDDIEEAVLEIEEPTDGEEPDRQTIAGYLLNAAETLKAAGVAAGEAVVFGQLAGQAASWLGPHADALLKMFGL